MYSRLYFLRRLVVRRWAAYKGTSGRSVTKEAI
jgi:hypothetical protein